MALVPWEALRQMAPARDYIEVDLGVTPSFAVQDVLGERVARLIVVTGAGTLKLTNPAGVQRTLTFADGSFRGFLFTAVELVSGPTRVQVAL